MDDFVQELHALGKRCGALAATLDTPATRALEERADETVERYQRAWSGSWIGYHADCYLSDFRAQTPDDFFDAFAGPKADLFMSKTRGEWMQVDGQLLREQIMSECGMLPENVLRNAAEAAGPEFDAIKQEVLTTLDVLLAAHPDPSLRELREQAGSMSSGNSVEEIVSVMRPAEVRTHDVEAMQGGLRTPAHRWVQALRLSWSMRRTQSSELSGLIVRAAGYLEKKLMLHRSGDLKLIRDVLSTPVPEPKRPVSGVSAGRDIVLNQTVTGGASVGSMSAIAKSVSAVTGEPDVTPASFERDVTEILHLLVERQEELEEEVRASKSVFKKLAALSPDEGNLRSLVRETLDERDRALLKRLKESGSNIAHSLAASSLFKFLESVT